MKTQLKADLIDYIQDKGFLGVEYSSNNTYPKNKMIVDQYLKICNKLNIIDKIQSVIDKNKEPLSIIYEELCKLYADEPMPEMIDNSYHVSKQADCLAMNTLNGYVDDSIIECNLLKDFSNELPITHISLTNDIYKHFREDENFAKQTDEEIERYITAIKTNVLSFKHANKKYPIYYGWIFESVMYNIIYDFTHKEEEKPFSYIRSDDLYIDYNVVIDKRIKDLEAEIDNNETVERYKKHLIEDIDLVTFGNRPLYAIYEKYLALGLRDLVNEQKNMDLEAVKETYMFIQNAISYFDDQFLGYITFIDLFKIYIKFILTHQIDHFLNTYIKTTFCGNVIDIIRKPSFNYACIKGEGDYILVIQRNIDIIHVLVDAKCYARVKQEDALRFIYQLIGYRQLHRHKLLIPSYRQNNNFDLSSFIIINPMNEKHRTLCYNYIKLEDYKDDLYKFENAYESFITKSITESF